MEDVKALKISNTIMKLFGRVIGLKNYISDAVTELQREADDSDEIKPGVINMCQL